MHKRCATIWLVLVFGAHVAAATRAWPQAGATTTGRTLTFRGPQGGPFSPSPLTFSHPAHQPPCPFTLTSTASWITVSPMQGDECVPVTARIEITEDAKRLAPGTYRGQLVFKSGVTVINPVVLIVGPPSGATPPQVPPAGPPGAPVSSDSAGGPAFSCGIVSPAGDIRVAIGKPLDFDAQVSGATRSVGWTFTRGRPAASASLSPRQVTFVSSGLRRVRFIAVGTAGEVCVDSLVVTVLPAGRAPR